jgi:hypothetical protein
MTDLAFVSNIDAGISRNISQRGFNFTRYNFRDLRCALSNGHSFTSVFDDGSLSIEDLRSLSQKCDKLYVPDFFRFRELARSGAQVKLFHHWVDEDFFYYKKKSSFSFDCFCYESINEELLRLLRRRFNVFVCGKGLTDGTKCSLLQKSKIYCHSEEGDLIGKEIFEAGGCGKMVLCNEIPSKDGMDMFFEDGVHLVNYENTEDCLKKIDLYLKDEYTRYEIGEGICNQIKKLHTSRKRAKEIIRDFIK